MMIKQDFVDLPQYAVDQAYVILSRRLSYVITIFFFFFLNSIIATPSAYRGRYAGCYYSIALLVVVYILGSCHASVAAEAPILSISCNHNENVNFNFPSLFYHHHSSSASEPTFAFSVQIVFRASSCLSPLV